MTQEEFLNELARIAPEFAWTIQTGTSRSGFWDACRLVRACRDGNGNWYCPITAVCEALTGRSYDTTLFERAGVEIGLSLSTARAIADATDGTPDLPDLREEILCAVGNADARGTQSREWVSP